MLMDETYRVYNDLHQRLNTLMIDVKEMNELQSAAELLRKIDTQDPEHWGLFRVIEFIADLKKFGWTYNNHQEEEK